MTHPMIVRDAEEMAGQFYELQRSDKFRKTWPNQMQFVKAAWPRFVKAVRAIYADLLGQERVSEDDKHKMYTALIADAPGAHSMEATDPLPLAPGTQAFEGDRAENRHTDETFGKVPDHRISDIRDYLMRSTSRSVIH